MQDEPIRVYARLRPQPVNGASVFSPGAILSPSAKGNNGFKSPLAGKRGVAVGGAPASAYKGLGAGFQTLRVAPPAKPGALPTTLLFGDGSSAGQDENGASEASGVVAFELDGVCGPHTDQLSAFELLGAPAVDSVVSGYNACLLAYGRSGSGKTHTILGPASQRHGESSWTWGDLEAETEDPSTAPCSLGLVPRAIHALLRHIAEEQERGGWEAPRFTVSLAVAEVYNNKLYDLLSPESGSAAASAAATAFERVEVREGRMTSSAADRLMSWHPINVAKGKGSLALGEARQLILKANAARIQASTELNLDSSRSHVLYLVKYTSSASPTAAATGAGSGTEGPGAGPGAGAGAAAGVSLEGMLSIVDLAGSETLDVAQGGGGSMGMGEVGGMGSPQASSSSSSTAAARNAETRAINSSLHVLTRVVAAYAGAGSSSSSSSKRPVHVPFRESLLTLLLKDSIGGNSRTAIVVTMNAEDPTQSYRTAQFAKLARGVRNVVRENKTYDPAAIITALREKVAELAGALEAARQREAGSGGGGGGGGDGRGPSHPTTTTATPASPLQLCMADLLDLATPPEFDHGAVLEKLADFMELSMINTGGGGEGDDGGAAADAAFLARVAQLGALARALRAYVRAAGKPLEPEEEEAAATAAAVAAAVAEAEAAAAAAAVVVPPAEEEVQVERVFGVDQGVQCMEIAVAAKAPPPPPAPTPAKKGVTVATVLTPELVRLGSRATAAGAAVTRLIKLTGRGRAVATLLPASSNSSSLHHHHHQYHQQQHQSLVEVYSRGVRESIDMHALRATSTAALIEACSAWIAHVRGVLLPRLVCQQGVLVEGLALRALGRLGGLGGEAGREARLKAHSRLSLAAEDAGGEGGGGVLPGGSDPALASQRDFAALAIRRELLEAEVGAVEQLTALMLEKELCGGGGWFEGEGGQSSPLPPTTTTTTPPPSSSHHLPTTLTPLPLDATRTWQWWCAEKRAWVDIDEGLCGVLDKAGASGEGVEVGGSSTSNSSGNSNTSPRTFPQTTPPPPPRFPPLSHTTSRDSSRSSSSSDTPSPFLPLLRSQDLHAITEAHLPGEHVAPFPQPHPSSSSSSSSSSHPFPRVFYPVLGTVHCGLTGAVAPLRRAVGLITGGGMFKFVGPNNAAGSGDGGVATARHDGKQLWREFRLTPEGLFQVQPPPSAKKKGKGSGGGGGTASGALPPLGSSAQLAASKVGCVKPKALFSSGLKYRAEALPACPTGLEWRIVSVVGGSSSSSSSSSTVPMAYFSCASVRDRNHWVSAFNGAASGCFVPFSPSPPTPPTHQHFPHQHQGGLSSPLSPFSPQEACARAVIGALSTTLASEAVMRAHDLSYTPDTLYSPPALVGDAGGGTQATAALVLSAAGDEVGIGWSGFCEGGMGVSPSGIPVALPVHPGGWEFDVLEMAFDSGSSGNSGSSGSGGVEYTLIQALRIQNSLAALSFATLARASRRSLPRLPPSSFSSSPATLSPPMVSTAWTYVDSLRDLASLALPPSSSSSSSSSSAASTAIPAALGDRLFTTPQAALEAQRVRLAGVVVVEGSGGGGGGGGGGGSGGGGDGAGGGRPPVILLAYRVLHREKPPVGGGAPSLPPPISLSSSLPSTLGKGGKGGGGKVGKGGGGGEMAAINSALSPPPMPATASLSLMKLMGSSSSSAGVSATPLKAKGGLSSTWAGSSIKGSLASTLGLSPATTTTSSFVALNPLDTILCIYPAYIALAARK